MMRFCLYIFALSVFSMPSVASTQPGMELQGYQQVLNNLLSSSAVRPADIGKNPVAQVYNREAIIPPQCYTRTEGKHNPCYICHQNEIPKRENVMNDGGLQQAYSFSDVGMSNHWKNLFEDRSERVAAISDEDILRWIDQDNYSALAGRLREAGFKGWIPDLKNLQLGAAAFDEQGFARDGSHWVAYNYKPLPSTFWPTNGSTDDVMIRLPESYRNNRDGVYSRDVYLANLAILEATIKGYSEIDAPLIDERRVGDDLDGDGRLGKIDKVRKLDRFVGAATMEFAPHSYMYPSGTEFLHTVRYVGFDANGDIAPSKRMKEVRYLRKWRQFDKGVYARNYQLEMYEKEAGNLPSYQYLFDYGLDNGFGWSVQGFIEARDGELRANTFEENLFCMGCHTSIGSTIDKTFSFARKMDGGHGWGYINLHNMPDAPNIGETQGEILTYLQRVGGGDEFRSNPEMIERWFDKQGQVDASRVQSAKDVYQLITPSRERALQLNKAYRVIVADQDFMFGRDATAKPPHNVYDRIDNETAPVLDGEHVYSWDIRLDWSGASQAVGRSSASMP